ncbi:unnamed protein product, partial [Didymodactylos carnosus]
FNFNISTSGFSITKSAPPPDITVNFEEEHDKMIKCLEDGTINDETKLALMSTFDNRRDLIVMEFELIRKMNADQIETKITAFLNRLADFFEKDASTEDVFKDDIIAMCDKKRIHPYILAIDNVDYLICYSDNVLMANIESVEQAVVILLAFYAVFKCSCESAYRGNLSLIQIATCDMPAERKQLLNKSTNYVRQFIAHLY